jgi:methyl-accepting chemotaxis protein
MRQADYQAQIDAISKSQAMIEFDLDGTIITANDNFLKAMGYTLDEVRGRHHRIFVDEAYARSAEYKTFWDRLKHGEYVADEFKRVGKAGNDVWIQASYNPIVDLDGRPRKVVKFATDITEQKIRNADYEGQIQAISKSQGMIEFDLDGTIISANDNFLNAMGYTLDEVRGRHHSIFVDEAHARSPEYKAFWDRLNRGEFVTDEFKRIGKGGNDVWIQASYNPILDLNGRPAKVVKFATDVTEQKTRTADYEGQIQAIGKSQGMIEFNMDGTIISANDNFLNAMGYTLDEVRGRHHSIFVDEAHARSPEYKAFWDRLNRGEFVADEFKRIGKAGNDVWIQASYNPILDLNGRPRKVVKFATDVTERVELQRAAAEQHHRTQELTGQVVESANQFAEGSRVIAESSANLSDGAQTQAASVEEMTASVAELTNAIQVISRSAAAAKEQARQTAASAEEDQPVGAQRRHRGRARG